MTKEVRKPRPHTQLPISFLVCLLSSRRTSKMTPEKSLYYKRARSKTSNWEKHQLGRNQHCAEKSLKFVLIAPDL